MLSSNYFNEFYLIYIDNIIYYNNLLKNSHFFVAQPGFLIGLLSEPYRLHKYLK